MLATQHDAQSNEAAVLNEERPYKCPDCAGTSHFMGIDFKAPKRTDVKAWAKAEAFIRSGKVFYRGVPQDES